MTKTKPSTKRLSIDTLVVAVKAAQDFEAARLEIEQAEIGRKAVLVSLAEDDELCSVGRIIDPGSSVFYVTETIEATRTGHWDKGSFDIFDIYEAGIYYVANVMVGIKTYTGPVFVSESGRVDPITDQDVMQWLRDEARSAGTDQILAALK